MFNPVALIATVPLTIDGVSYAFGDPLTVSAVKIGGALLAMGKARLASTPAPQVRRRRTRRTYRRRDLQAE